MSQILKKSTYIKESGQNFPKSDTVFENLWNAISPSSEGVVSSSLDTNLVSINILKIWCGFLKIWRGFWILRLVSASQWLEILANFKTWFLQAQKELRAQILSAYSPRPIFSKSYVGFEKSDVDFSILAHFHCSTSTESFSKCRKSYVVRFCRVKVMCSMFLLRCGF